MTIKELIEAFNISHSLVKALLGGRANALLSYCRRRREGVCLSVAKAASPDIKVAFYENFVGKLY